MRNDGCTYRDRVRADGAGQTVVTFYAARYRQATAAEWRARVEAGQVTLDGRRARPDEPLAAGQALAYHRPPWDEPDVPTALPVLHADEALVAFDKPAGLPTLPGAGCLWRSVLHLARERFGPTVTAVHRLDRGTSGVIVLARSPEAARFLCRGFARRLYEKVYLAKVQGSDLPDTFTLTTPIGPVPHPPVGFVSGTTPEGRPAVTHGTVLRREADTTLVAVRPETGRAQQVRVHLAAAGWPLVGEPLYAPGGRPRPVAPGERPPVSGDVGFLLHAWRLRLRHPTTREWLALEAPPPPALAP
jgi:23S rRNA pseudouridine1911/1915/1917 synthase